METPTEFPCPQCGALSPFRLRPETPHYGEIRCLEHGHHWISKPDNEKRQKRKPSRKLLKLIPEDRQTFCWRCLREEAALLALMPALILEVHHVIEVCDGGSNDLINLQVLCGECHEETGRDRRRYKRYGEAA
jgi:5-methylcytosine-specific restriction endonuclease McrA